MRNLRAIVWLTMSAISLIAIHVMLFNWRKLPETVMAQALAASDKSPMTIEVKRVGDAPTILKFDGEWQVIAPYRGKADSSTVNRLVDGIVNARVIDSLPKDRLAAISKTKEDFGLKSPMISVALGYADGSTDTLSFGGATPAGDGVYVDKAGVSSILVVDLDVLSKVDIAADRFRDRSVMSSTLSDVVEFVIRKGKNERYRLAKSAEGWQNAKGKAISTKVEEFLRQVTTAQIKEFIWPVGNTNESVVANASLLTGYGLDAESAIAISLKFADGSIHELLVGKECDNGRAYAYVQDGSAIVTVDVALKDAAFGDVSKFFDTRLFPVEPKSVSAFSIVTERVRYSFAASASGDWFLESPIVAPADPKFVENVLARLLSLTQADIVERGVQVAIGANAKTFIVSEERALAGMKMITARSCEILKIPEVKIRRLSQITEKQSLSVSFDRDRRVWNIDGGAISEAKPSEKNIAAIVAALGLLNAVRVERVSVSAADLVVFGLDRPEITIAVDCEASDLPRRNILVGAKVKGGGRYVTVGASDAVFVVADEVIERLSAPLAF